MQVVDRDVLYENKISTNYTSAAKLNVTYVLRRDTCFVAALKSDLSPDVPKHESVPIVTKQLKRDINIRN
jgi:hypothetical protein